MVTDWFCVGGKIPCFLDYYQSFSKEYAWKGWNERRDFSDNGRDNILLHKESSTCLQLCLLRILLNSSNSHLKMEEK